MNMRNNLVLRSFIGGVQECLIDRGLVKYASEEDAALDNEALSAGISELVPEHVAEGGLPGTEIDPAALVEGDVPAEVTAPIADAIIEMAQQVSGQAEDLQNKAAIIESAAAAMASSEKVAFILKAAEDAMPDVGSEPATDADRQVATGTQGAHADEGVGMTGVQTSTPAPAPAAMASATPIADVGSAPANDLNRANAEAPQGTHAAEGTGMIGTETEKTSGDRVNAILHALRNL